MLTTCSECNGKISDKATACPHCGHSSAATAATVTSRDPIRSASDARSKSEKSPFSLAIAGIVGLLAVAGMADAGYVIVGAVRNSAARAAEQAAAAERAARCPSDMSKLSSWLDAAKQGDYCISQKDACERLRSLNFYDKDDTVSYAEMRSWPTGFAAAVRDFEIQKRMRESWNCQ